MDIDKGSAVWNYSYDYVNVSQHIKCGIEHKLDYLNYEENKGYVIYYNFKINSSAYPEHNLDIWAYVYTQVYIDNNNRLVKTIYEGWLSDEHPDFIWKKYKLDTEWNGKSYINPEIDVGLVYKLYKHFIDEKNNNKILLFR